ncbi:MAG TPA: hypothetical protein VJS69_03025 [Candidatus Krumholzibacteria bacterium]|nr:hypothetical protein [Candidatus Krumholzibacteria bacterium]
MNPVPRYQASDFDAVAMCRAMDARRAELGLSWKGVADALWEQSALLNAQRNDHPISASTLTGIAKRRDCTCQHALFILRWLDVTPEHFVDGARDTKAARLPDVGSDHRLRWDLKALYAALDEARQQRDMTWTALAEAIGCTSHQLTGIKTARYAISMVLAMRIVQWLGRPAAAFVYAARW